MSRRRDEVLAPEVLVVTFVSPGGLVASDEAGPTVLRKRRLAFLVISLLLPTVGFHVADLVTVETLLVLVRTRRLGLNLVLAILALFSPSSTETPIGTKSFSFLVLERVDTSVPILSKELSLPACSTTMAPDRRVLAASLEHGLPHVVSHGLTALFLALLDQVPELFDPIDELSELPEVIQENLPEHAPQHLHPLSRSAVSSGPHRSCSG